MIGESQGPESPLESAFNEAGTLVGQTLEALLPPPAGPEARLLEAMRASARTADLKLRAFLVLQAGGLFGVDRRVLGRVAAAVECVAAHARARDGSGTADPAHAALAGDGLFALAFGLLASPESAGDPFVRCELVARLAHVAGHSGMAGGEALALAFAGAGVPPPLPELSRHQHMKTAALISLCCEAGALLGRASPPARHALSAYGQDVGLALQIARDLEGTDQFPTPTVVTALGAERAAAQAAALAAQAVRHLDLFDEKADLLRTAAEYAVAPRGAAAA
ncbi:MAG: polyprenyl synthetase family protein [Alphaproteobacteria bacterium]|nr:polyprenyl synthetase family protein [Alphaproteobacteria bacterium]MDE2014347.1 polyprenyl synthetase family protein [Alphaproteobacteria bacterium]MDE2073657.1 polyprenyl synthetase family protein [Alphaproteobacteria bacterium]MDE2352047.1 polyprenyl synthetase family protein [Alphaproteobacteria bacterium]